MNHDQKWLVAMAIGMVIMMQFGLWLGGAVGVGICVRDGEYTHPALSIVVQCTTKEPANVPHP